MYFVRHSKYTYPSFSVRIKLILDILFYGHTGSEDGTVRVWHANTHRLESSLNYGFERVWAITCLKGSNNVAIGYDEGII